MQDVLPFVKATNHSYVSSLSLFAIPNEAHYSFSKFGIVAEDEEVQKNAKTFFEEYVFPISTNAKISMSNWTVDTFSKQEDLFHKISTIPKQPYCCGLTFKKFDTKTDTYEIEMHFSKLNVPDTNLQEYNPMVRLPDLKAWQLWFTKGSIAVYPYITEFIARSKTGYAMNETKPAFHQ